MKDFFQRPEVRYAMFAFFILLTRFPFLYDGYGLDSDSWSVAITARNIAHTGMYEASRFPAYPVHELMSALFYNGKYFNLNFITAIISTIGFLYFAMMLRRLHFKYPFLAATALAFVPVNYIASTVSIDYMWALTFIIIAMYFAVRRKPMKAGIYLGIAIGCRITSGAMIVPLAILVVHGTIRERNVKRIIRFVLAALITGAMMYLPVFLKYGWKFFSYYDAPYLSIPAIFYKFFIGVWGVVGTFALGAAVLLLFLPDKITARKYLFPRSVNEKYVIAWLLAMDLYIIAFLRLPMESGYLVPMVPFVILLLGKYLYDKAFAFFSFLLILSPFILALGPVDRNDAPSVSSLSYNINIADEPLALDVLKGPVFTYQSRRKNGMDFTSGIVSSFDTIQRKALVVSGKWYNQLTLLKGDSLNQNILLFNYISRDTLLSYLGKNYLVYYLPQQDYNNQLMHNYDINLFSGLPYIAKK